MMAPRVGKTDKYTRSTDHPLFSLDRPTDRAPTANGEGNSFPPGRKIVATVAVLLPLLPGFLIRGMFSGVK